MSDEVNKLARHILDWTGDERDARRAVKAILAAQSLSKDLAIKLAVSELEKIAEGQARFNRDFSAQAIPVIKNLLTGLGCEAVVEAWNECT